MPAFLVMVCKPTARLSAYVAFLLLMDPILLFGIFGDTIFSVDQMCRIEMLQRRCDPENLSLVARDGWRSDITPWTVSAGLWYGRRQSATFRTAFKILLREMVSFRYSDVSDYWISVCLHIILSTHSEGEHERVFNLTVVSDRCSHLRSKARVRSGVWNHFLSSWKVLTVTVFGVARCLDKIAMLYNRELKKTHVVDFRRSGQPGRIVLQTK